MHSTAIAFLEVAMHSLSLLALFTALPLLPPTLCLPFPSPQGPEAEAVMQQLCANNMAVEPGQVVYTGMLNTRGGFQTDCTVTRLSKNKWVSLIHNAYAYRCT